MGIKQNHLPFARVFVTTILLALLAPLSWSRVIRMKQSKRFVHNWTH